MQQQREPLLAGSHGSLQASTQQNSSNPTTKKWDLYHLGLFGICIALLIIGVILAVGAYKNAQDIVNPTYVMYNATIYASSSHAQGPSGLELDLESNPRPGKSGLNPFEYNTAMVIGSDGRFYDLGSDDEILGQSRYSSLPQVNMNKAVISPGFADAHGHFMSYGLGFLEPDVRTANGPSQFIQQLLSFCKEYHIDPQSESDSWLVGGRWDESQWGTDPDYDYYVDPDTGIHPFPTHKLLDQAFPKLGVALKRVDGHACFVNKVVLDMIELPDVDPPGGQIIRDADGNPTGVLIDYACEILWKYKQSQPSPLHYRTALSKSMQQLTSMGLTSAHDASMLNSELFASHLLIPRTMIQSKAKKEPQLLSQQNLLAASSSSLYDPFPMRIHGMVDAEAICAVYNYTCPDPYPFNPIDQHNPIILKNGTHWVQQDRFEIDPGTNSPDFNILPKVLGSKNARFDVSATKLMSDGALGSWGAFLSKPYTDKPSTRGIQMYSKDQLNNAVLNLANQGFQVCTHAIGDGAVQQVLDSYEHAAERLNASIPTPESRRAQFIRQRHRIEHFQIIPPHNNWASVMEKYGILASMQSIHAVADRSFAETRLGAERLNGQGYLWREIESTNDLLPLGTDFPVSSPNVIQNVYSAVTMMEIGHDLPPFLPDNTLHIIDALIGVTADPAYAQHREHEYGKISKGYIADFIILSEDWLGFTNETFPDDRDIGKLIAKTKVLATFVDGNAVFEHQDVNVATVEGKNHFYQFNHNNRNVGDKKPWYAVRQPAKSPMVKSIHDQHLVKIVNKLKQETSQYIQQLHAINLLKSPLENSNNKNNLPSLETISRHPLFLQIDTTSYSQLEQEYEQQIHFWSEMRFLTPLNRLGAIQNYLGRNTTTPHIDFQHNFLSFSDTPVKVIEHEYGHHHHAKDSSKYRANTIYKTTDDQGNDIIVQPRVPPCIEHMGTREAAERRHFSYPHLEKISHQDQIALGLPIVN